jgi:hypothetical protein
VNGQWSKFDAKKMSLLDYVQPDPATLRYNPNTDLVCVRPGKVRARLAWPAPELGMLC